jgi:hypothetical protein
MRVAKEKKDIIEKSGNHTSLTDVEMKQYLKSGLDEIKFIKNRDIIWRKVWQLIDCICIARTMMSSNNSILLHKVSAILVQL